MLVMVFILREWVLQNKNEFLGHTKMGRKQLGRKIKEGKWFFFPLLVMRKKLIKE